MDKIKGITAEDRLLVDKIIVGMCKMISSVTSRDVKKRAKALSKRHTKSLVYTAVDNVPTNTKFRPSDIRKKLPKELQGIQYADMTDILSSYTRLSKLKKVRPKTQYREDIHAETMKIKNLLLVPSQLTNSQILIRI